ncbi:MAG: transcriptional regulator, family [Anaerocolumna sp.]|jgi:transcriptional regulator with XRE-family HTH domain|nr:transcriptional regulator, family [Anaerocolumna sp.]
MSELLLKDKLRELRTRMHYTQNKVGQYLNMTRQGYAHYEAGLRSPDYQTLLKLSKLYQVDINELINNHTTPIIHDVVHENEIFSSQSNNQKLPPRVIQLNADEKKLFNLYSKLSDLEKQEFLLLLENKVRDSKKTDVKK